LDYRGPQPGSRPPLVLGVIAGVVAGSLLSFVAYWFGVAFWFITPVVVLVIKLVLGFRLRSDDRTRGFAIGVLASIGLGVLIFLGLCGRALQNI
jgi:hypothetical protein